MKEFFKSSCNVWTCVFLVFFGVPVSVMLWLIMYAMAGIIIGITQ